MDDILATAKTLKVEDLMRVVIELNQILTEKMMRELPQHLATTKPEDK